MVVRFQLGLHPPRSNVGTSSPTNVSPSHLDSYRGPEPHARLSVAPLLAGFSFFGFVLTVGALLLGRRVAKRFFAVWVERYRPFRMKTLNRLAGVEKPSLRGILGLIGRSFWISRRKPFVYYEKGLMGRSPFGNRILRVPLEELDHFKEDLAANQEAIRLCGAFINLLREKVNQLEKANQRKGGSLNARASYKILLEMKRCFLIGLETLAWKDQKFAYYHYYYGELFESMFQGISPYINKDVREEDFLADFRVQLDRLDALLLTLPEGFRQGEGREP